MNIKLLESIELRYYTHTHTLAHTYIHTMSAMIVNFVLCEIDNNINRTAHNEIPTILLYAEFCLAVIAKCRRGSFGRGRGECKG